MNVIEKTDLQTAEHQEKKLQKNHDNMCLYKEKRNSLCLSQTYKSNMTRLHSFPLSHFTSEHFASIQCLEKIIIIKRRRGRWDLLTFRLFEMFPLQ